MAYIEPIENYVIQKHRLQNNFVYWIPKILIALFWTFGAIGSVSKAQASMEVFHRLGYPDYFVPMLGTAQLLAVAAILAPVPLGLREWAYAGLTFDATAAIFSLLASGSPIFHLSFPIIALALVQISYWTWQPRKRVMHAQSLAQEQADGPPSARLA